VLFVGIFSRMVPFQAMMSLLPSVTQRGSFNAINASIQQLSGGLASVIAGHIVTLAADGKLEHMDMIGYCIVGASVVSLSLMWTVQRTQAKPVVEAVAAH
jgi:hypothetical protein